MVAHEYAHGYAALKQGDPTAYQLGRLTWNPIKHIDPFLTILMPILTFWGSNGSFMFGGAKPVPVVPSNYRNYRRGDIIVSLAGVATNMALFVACAALIVLIGVAGRPIQAGADTLGIVQIMLLRGILFNLILAIFNLLPIPPLDGSHVVKYLMPPAMSLRYQQLGRYGLIILIVLIATPIGRPVFSFWMTPVSVLYQESLRLVYPYFLRSPFGIGVG
jgi:Zn-dependent protease